MALWVSCLALPFLIFVMLFEVVKNYFKKEIENKNTKDNEQNSTKNTNYKNEIR